jgi:phospholipid N-methyltransferase
MTCVFISATYSPEDNKLRLYPAARLDKDLYLRVKGAGFIWAPKQGIFVAPKWTPAREDLCMELAGEISDEDISLVERAEQRAERFEEYGENREADAHRAHEAVARIADGIPLGQPILVGHHSERHARRDAEKIENGMRKAVKAWETAKYWESRAAGAIRAAKYKELPAVRARRIKTLEAEIRSLVADYTPHAEQPAIMQTPYSFKSQHPYGTPEYEAEHDAARVPHVWVGPKGSGGRWVQASSLERIEKANRRSIEHRQMRLIYERAMLAEAGGLVADRFDMAVGGRVKYSGTWYVIARLNRKDGVTMSVSLISSSWPSVLNVEDIQEYEPPTEQQAEKVKAVTKLAPLVNYRAPGCVEMTTAQWADKSRFGDTYFVAQFLLDGKYAGFGKRGDYRQRSVMQRGGGDRDSYFSSIPVFLTDSKVIEPKGSAPKPTVQYAEIAPVREDPRPTYKAPERTVFDDLKDSLKAGVTVVSAPQLFPTPPDLARRMVALSGLQAGETVLEPSAGTGAIVSAIIEAVDTEIVGYEINFNLVSRLTQTFPSYKLQARCEDFLTVTEGRGQFPVVIMNPPFENGSDIKHIEHAIGFLKPGGTLVALCADGPRQRAALMDRAEHWEEIPSGTFAGTGVRAALMVIRGVQS